MGLVLIIWNILPHLLLFAEPRECRPAVNLVVLSRAHPFSTIEELRRVLEEAFCEIKADILLRDKSINRNFVHRLLPRPSFPRVSPLLFYDRRMSFSGRPSDRTRLPVHVVMNPRENLKYILLHELAHLSGFPIQTERRAHKLTELYYSWQNVEMLEPREPKHSPAHHGELGCRHWQIRERIWFEFRLRGLFIG